MTHRELTSDEAAAYDELRSNLPSEMNRALDDETAQRTARMIAWRVRLHILDRAVIERHKPYEWDDLKPYEQQQGGYWLYWKSTGIHGEGRTWIPVAPGAGWSWRGVKIAARRAGYRIDGYQQFPDGRERWLVIDAQDNHPWYAIVSRSDERGWDIKICGPWATIHLDTAPEPGPTIVAARLAGLFGTGHNNTQ